jgi:hypothetical protein
MKDLEKLIELENLKWLAKPALDQIDDILNYVFEQPTITSVLVDGDDLDNKYVVLFSSNDEDGDSYFSGSFDLTKETYDKIIPWGEGFYEMQIDELVDNLITILKSEKYVSYENCQNIVQANGIMNVNDYKKFVNANPNLNLPLHPDKVY